MAKKTTEICFANPFALMDWQKVNCEQCTKMVTFNKRLNIMPKYKCAIQRDIEAQQSGEMEISARSFEASKLEVCKFINRKEAEVNDIIEIENSNINGKSIAPQKQTKNDNNVIEETCKRRAKMYGLKECEDYTKYTKEADNSEKDDNGSMIFRTPSGTYTAEDFYVIKKQYVSIAEIIIGSAIDIADSYMRDTLKLIKKYGLYKFKIKQTFNQAMSERDIVYKNIKERIEGCNKWQLYMDTLDEIQFSLRDDISKLYWSMMQILDKNNIKQSDMKAHIEVVHMFLFLACEYFTTICRIARNTHSLKIAPSIIKFYPIRAFGAWHKLAKDLCMYGEFVSSEMDNDKNIRLARDIIESKLVELDYIEENCQRAKYGLDVNASKYEKPSSRKELVNAFAV